MAVSADPWCGGERRLETRLGMKGVLRSGVLLALL